MNTMKIRVKKIVNPETKLITLSLADVNFGPVVSGFSEKEVEEKFNKAMRVTLIFKTFMSIKDMLSNKFDESIIQKTVEENKNFELEYAA
jgi:hypothetical protein